jgi:polar amino acid transport system substrate-binding protein
MFKSCRFRFMIGLCVVLIAFLMSIIAESVAKSPIVVFIGDTVAPKMYAKDGKPAGSIYAIVKEAMSRAGYEAEYSLVPFSRGVESAKRGGGIMPSLAYSEERAKVLFYTKNPMYKDRVNLITMAKSDFPYSGAKDLVGRIIGMQRGSVYGGDFATIRSSVNLSLDDGIAQRLRKLMVGRIEGAIVPGGMGGFRYAVKEIGADEKQFIVKTPPLTVDNNYIGIAKTYPDGQEIINRIDKALTSMWADGTIDKLVAENE